jgi:iron complex transport system substrate-binding protein
VVKIFFLIFLFSACSPRQGAPVRGEVNRVISTAPSNTEIIVDLGMIHKLVAIDRHSANIEGIPAGLPLLDFFYPDAEVIINLMPDLIIASGHNPTGSGEDPFRLLREIGIPVVYISMSRSINDIYNDIALIAELLHAVKEGEALIAAMKAEVAQIAAQIAAETTTQIAANGKTPVSVYFEISAAPVMMTFGKNSFIHDMIFVLGARNIFENEDWLVTPGAEIIINRNPDIIFTNVNYIDNPIGEIKSRPGFNNINAVRNNRVYQIDTDSSSRSSARIVFALQQMARALEKDTQWVKNEE